MSIDLTTLITNLQADVDAVDSSTSMSSILSLLHKARKITSISNYYDSAGLLPVDSAYDGMLAFSKADNTMYKFVDSGINAGTVQAWHKADSASSSSSDPTPIAYGGANAYVIYNGIGKFDMSSTTNASQIPALGSPPYYPSISREIMGGRSSTHGYFSGGGVPTTVDTIRSFPFAAEDALSDTTADLTQIRRAAGLEATGDGIDVYTLGGFNPGIGAVDTVDKFPTANNSNATDVGNLTVAALGVMPATSSTHGYRSGGGDPGAEYNIIDKFPFASGGNSTDVGDNTDHRQRGVGASSTTHGYAAGGYDLPTRINIIDKYPFSSDTNATDVGDLTGTDHDGAGASSPTYGFFMGGGAGTTTNEIQRWAFASDGNASDTADLYEAIRYGSSTHDTA